MTSETTTPTRIEPLYVLYGSQTGNSEGAAKDFCALVKDVYCPAFFEQHGLPLIHVTPHCMQLDDFLELKHAAFTKCLVIFVSSYGVGQAPLGAYRFRELCDYWAQNDDHGAPLQGLQYALCGLGDSTYPTKFVNPTRIDRGLTAAGARRIGQLAMADAHGSGPHAQDVTISNWIQDVWFPLAQQLTKTEPLVDTLKMQQATIPLLIQLDPDYQPPKEFRTRGVSGDGDATVPCSPIVLAGLAVAGIGAAVLALQFH